MNVLTDIDRVVIFAFAENNMSVAETARQSYLCRGSVEYHLHRVHQKTGLNPYKFYDLVELVERTKRPTEAKG